jgi:homoserine O-acetyltransferase
MQSRSCQRAYALLLQLYISKAMDMFDMGRGYDSLADGLRRIKAPALILGVQSDILFPVKQQKEVADILKAQGNCGRVTYYELDALYGHDTFLLDVLNVGRAVKGHLDHD